MRIYFAPLEGITGYTYRNAFHEFWGKGIDKYYTPFIASAKEGCIKNRSLRDVLPKNNQGLSIVPQILSNNAEDFIALAKQLMGQGYKEINFNLGCPYGTVTAKGKGSGFLARKEELAEFFDMVFAEFDRLYSDYLKLMQSDKNTLFKMKELWNYWQYLFEGAEEQKAVEKYLKQIRKAQRGRDYESAVRGLFAACEVKEGACLP